MRRKSVLCRSICILAVVLLIAGCSAPVAETAEIGVATHAGADLRVARALAPAGAFADLDPSTACIVEFQVLMNVYETLTVYTPPGSAEAVRPGLATDWAVTDDGRTWAFHLREGATFRDGAPVDAAAVKFSIERNRALSTCAAYIYDALEAIDRSPALPSRITCASTLPPA